MNSLFKAIVKLHVALYRLTGGRLGSRFKGGAPVLLLTTTGRKTGKRRTNPLLFVEDDDGYAVVASAGGAPKHPAWYLNLRNNPEVHVQVKNRRMNAYAETTGEEDRARLWPELNAIWPDYDKYQGKTSRQIPVVILRRRSAVIEAARLSTASSG
jgi:deazaflavin-dependent oxidoreductase (nitroreductase family)